MTPIWPLPASIKGSAEPGSIVEVEGIGPVELDRRGGFRISTSLAPWPQTLTVTATDASGNETVREVSLIGGVDYRRFPWPTIAAVVLLIVVAISGASAHVALGEAGQRSLTGLIVSGSYANVVASMVGAAVGERGLRAAGPAANLVVFGLFAFAVVTLIAGLVLALVGAYLGIGRAAR